MKITIEDSDIAEFQRISHDYFGMIVSDGAARHLCETAKAVQAELIYGGLGDTAARDDVIDAIVAFVMTDAPPPDPNLQRCYGGARDRWCYPLNGDSSEYTVAFAEAFDAAAEKLPPDRKIEAIP